MAWLTQDDVNNYGTELIDVTQRAALHAVAPALQNLEQQNAELQRRLAQEQRHRLDQQVAAAVPDFRQIDADPRWHQWLRQPDQLSGVPRQTLLNDAISSGSAARVRAFFEGFRRESGGNQSSGSVTSAPNRTRSSSSGKPIYSRDQIAKFYDDKRRGAYVGREAELARIEVDLCRASAEGRILNPVDLHGK